MAKKRTKKENVAEQNQEIESVPMNSEPSTIILSEDYSATTPSGYREQITGRHIKPSAIPVGYHDSIDPAGSEEIEYPEMTIPSKLKMQKMKQELTELNKAISNRPIYPEDSVSSDGVDYRQAWNIKEEVKVNNKSKHTLPEYKTSGASGVDICANLGRNFLRLMPGQRMLVPTGIFLDLPEGMEAQVRPRSGLAHKKGVTVINAPGSVDSDYRGEIFVNLINLSSAEQMIEDGERIAQLVFAKVDRVSFREVSIEDFTVTERGDNGHGSTGTI